MHTVESLLDKIFAFGPISDLEKQVFRLRDTRFLIYSLSLQRKNLVTFVAAIFLNQLILIRTAEPGC